MRSSLWFSMLLAACAPARYAARTEPVPPAPVQESAQVTHPAMPQHDEAATQKWLEGEIERAKEVQPPPPPPRVEVVERVVEKPVRVYDSDPYYARTYYPYGYGYSYYPYATPRRSSTFPANTILGAGVGALIGRHNHRTARGVWIGSSLGFLLDWCAH